MLPAPGVFSIPEKPGKSCSCSLHLSLVLFTRACGNELSKNVCRCFYDDRVEFRHHVRLTMPRHVQDFYLWIIPDENSKICLSPSQTAEISSAFPGLLPDHEWLKTPGGEALSLHQVRRRAVDISSLLQIGL